MTPERLKNDILVLETFIDGGWFEDMYTRNEMYNELQAMKAELNDMEVKCSK